MRAAMARADFTQGRLAQAIGMSPSSLSERLSGQRPFNTDHLSHIADVLEVDVFSLMVAPDRAAS